MKKLYWGLAILIILLIGVSVVILTQPTDTETKTIYKDVEPSKEVMDTTGKQNLNENSQPAENAQHTAEKPVNKVNAEVGDTTEAAEQPNAASVENLEVGAETEEPEVSPNGFGPYPQVPEDYIAAIGKTTWMQRKLSGAPPAPPQIELIQRVMIKLWTDGDKSVTSGYTDNDGKIYIHRKNTAYVRFQTETRADGTTYRIISQWTGPSSTPRPTLEEIRSGVTPSGVTLIDLDKEDAGIDPIPF